MPFMLNSVHIAGNLTRDPELKQIGSNSIVANFGLAINRRYKGNDGAFKEETTFVEIEVWGRQAELASQYLFKGRNCMIEGSLQLNQWLDKDNKTQSRMRIKAQKVHFLGQNAEAAPSSGTSPAEDSRVRSPLSQYDIEETAATIDRGPFAEDESPF